MEKQRYFFWLGISFLGVFLLFMIHKGYLTHDMHIAFNLGSFSRGTVEHGIGHKMQIVFRNGIPVFGGAISNIYWLIIQPSDFIIRVFFSLSLAHIYVSYRLVRYMWQAEVLKWYWWGIWVVNCYVWFFMGSIIPLMMRL